MGAEPLPIPSHHSLVENMDWVGLFEARRHGQCWDCLRTRTGLSALGQAVVHDESVIVEQLLRLGAPTHHDRLFDGGVFSPLWIAMEREHRGVVEMLLRGGADPNAVRPENHVGSGGAAHETPLGYAARRGMSWLVALLCQFGAFPNEVDKSSGTVPGEQVTNRLRGFLPEWRRGGVWRELGLDCVSAAAALVEAGWRLSGGARDDLEEIGRLLLHTAHRADGARLLAAIETAEHNTMAVTARTLRQASSQQRKPPPGTARQAP